STGTFYTVTLDIDASGTVTNTAGFPSPMTGKFFYQSPYVGGHMVATAIVGPSPWNEINIRDAALAQNGLLMSGTFGIDCTDCPAGTFYLGMCGAVGVDDRAPSPPSPLHPIYPNPFNPRTTITYSLREAGRVDLRVYDAAGRLVKILVGEQKPAGTYTEFWNGTDDRGGAVSSGVYFVRLVTDGAVYSRKAVLLK
ncbi:MAG: T9SS type A sorting domain-containing protein, partial [bacterium]